MSLTRPLPYVYVLPADQPVTIPDSLNGLTVALIEGGTVARSGTALAPADVMAAGDVLTATPAVTDGHVHLTLHQAGVLFSGSYLDLTNRPSPGSGGETGDATYSDTWMPIWGNFAGGPPTRDEAGFYLNSQYIGYRTTLPGEGSGDTLQAMVRVTGLGGGRGTTVTGYAGVVGQPLIAVAESVYVPGGTWTLIELPLARTLSWQTGQQLDLIIAKEEYGGSAKVEGQVVGAPYSEGTDPLYLSNLEIRQDGQHGSPSSVTPDPERFPLIQLGTRTLATATVAPRALPVLDAAPLVGPAMVRAGVMGRRPRLAMANDGRLRSVTLHQDDEPMRLPHFPAISALAEDQEFGLLREDLTETYALVGRAGTRTLRWTPMATVSSPSALEELPNPGIELVMGDPPRLRVRYGSTMYTLPFTPES